MKLVRQKHKTGCGIASVAMLADIEYSQAVKIVHPRRKKFDRYTTTIPQLVQALNKLKLRPKYIHTTDQSISDLKHDALIILHESDNDYHAVVWDAETQSILDPNADDTIQIKGTTLMIDGKRMSATKYYDQAFHSYIRIKR